MVIQILDKKIFYFTITPIRVFGKINLLKSNLNVHPRIDDVIKYIKTIDDRNRDMYYKVKSSGSDKAQNKKEFIKNLNIELLHEEFYQEEISFNEYFEKLTHQMLSPYEQFLENNDKDIEHVEEILPITRTLKFKKDKLLNNLKNIDFMSLLNNKINHVKNVLCEEKI
ncbi:unnamed protein product [Brachionus calyciflorus]|uniref:Uncharacterized protein n=1 Tax=Brachionus calyciflorus TaxID=104777 RepID=A0A814MW60_9BILA|nr:unnamed protein product [Brachionus calyciflorus]